MRVLLTATSFSAHYGGPSVSVPRLARELGSNGVEVSMWAPDGSAGQRSIDRVIAGTGLPHLIHDNGIWNPNNHAIARFASRHGIPRIVSPRGMLEPWARQHKRLKKALAWRLYQKADLDRAALLHAATDVERATIAGLSLRPGIEVIPNGIEMPSAASGENQKPDVMTALFVGRIYPIKGLPMLLDAWSRVRPAGWKLIIAGMDEAGHRSTLERKISELGLGEVVWFAGHVDGNMKSQLFREADLFVMPSFTESFGMAIGEALSYGLPVLTTTGTPWSSIPERGCGWRVDPTVDRVADALQAATALRRPELRAMGTRSVELAREFQWDEVAARFIELYEAVIQRASRLRPSRSSSSIDARMLS